MQLIRLITVKFLMTLLEIPTICIWKKSLLLNSGGFDKKRAMGTRYSAAEVASYLLYNRSVHAQEKILIYLIFDNKTYIINSCIHDLGLVR